MRSELAFHRYPSIVLIQQPDIHNFIHENAHHDVTKQQQQQQSPAASKQQQEADGLQSAATIGLSHKSILLKSYHGDQQFQMKSCSEVDP